MDLSKFTERSRGFIQAAQTIATRESHQRLAPEHLLKALVDDDQGLARNLIKRLAGKPSAVVEAMELALGKMPKVTGDAAQVYLDNATAKVLAEAEALAKKAGDSFVPVERDLDGVVHDQVWCQNGAGGGQCNRTRAERVRSTTVRKGRTADTATAEEGYDALKKYARDLTERPREGKIDPIIGRDEEIRRAMQVLSAAPRTTRF